MCADAHKGQERMLNPLSPGCWKSHRCWESHSGSLKKHQGLLKAELPSCLSHDFSIAEELKWPRQPLEGWVYLACGSRRVRVHQGRKAWPWADMEAGAVWAFTLELPAKATECTQSRVWDFETSEPITSDMLLPTKPHSSTYPVSATHLEPTIQMPEAMRGHLSFRPVELDLQKLL